MNNEVYEGMARDTVEKAIAKASDYVMEMVYEDFEDDHDDHYEEAWVFCHNMIRALAGTPD